MTTFSPMTAATEGLRVIRREPMALVGWIGIWVLALVFVTVVQLLTVGHADVQPPKQGVAGLIARFGPFWPVLVTTIFTLIMMSSSTLFRAVLTPTEHGWHLFKLGAAEVRLAVITIAVTLVLVAFGGLPSLILLLFAKPILAAVPGSGPWVVWLGTAATLCIDVWIGVRLSLAPVHTFAEGRFHVFGYWRLTQGNFWRLLLSYVYLAVQIVLVFIVAFLGLFLIGEIANTIAAGHLNFWSRALLFGMAGVAALLLAILFVVPLTLVCACQALAYSAIVKPDPGAPWGASRRSAWPGAHARVPRREV
jgi:hypothetical protein